MYNLGDRRWDGLLKNGKVMAMKNLVQKGNQDEDMEREKLLPIQTNTNLGLALKLDERIGKLKVFGSSIDFALVGWVGQYSRVENSFCLIEKDLP